MKPIMLAALSLALAASPAGSEAKPSPGVSGTLSLIPGLGQVANGDTWEGISWFSTTLALLIARDPVARKFGMNFWFYNMYDAYRDAGASRAARHGLLENYLANINPANLIDPIGAPIVAFAALSPGNTASHKGTPSQPAMRAFYYSSVGLGEEALFRGFLFPAFSSGLGTFGGAVLSSAIFSAAHGEGGSAFVFRFLGGMLFCWQVHRNKYDLRPSIFAHTWFDFLITRKGNTKGEIEVVPVFKYQFRF
jgi:hypothetical protein